MPCSAAILRTSGELRTPVAGGAGETGAGFSAVGAAAETGSGGASASCGAGALAAATSPPMIAITGHGTRPRRGKSANATTATDASANEKGRSIVTVCE